MRPESVLRIGLLIAFIGILDSNPFIIIPGGALFLFGFVSWFYSKHLPGGITGSFNFSKRRAFHGEKITGILQLKNDQPFPLPWVTCTMEWPEELQLSESGLLVKHETKDFFKSSYSMHGFEIMKRNYEITCLTRGEYKVEAITVKVADPFGFSEGKTALETKDRILVYPRMVPLSFDDKIFNNPFGGKALQSWLYEDPANFRGIRDYLPSDPFSRISWKATARAGTLQTKIFDASFATEITVVLNITTSKFVWELNSEQLERSVVVAASIIRRCYEQGYRFSFYANSTVGVRQAASVGIGAGEKHLRRCLEVMARIMPYQYRKCEYTLAYAARKTGENSQLILVTSMLTPEITRTLNELRKSGSRVIVIYTSREQPEETEKLNVPVYKIAERGEWDELEQITFIPVGR